MYGAWRPRKRDASDRDASRGLSESGGLYWEVRGWCGMLTQWVDEAKHVGHLLVPSDSPTLAVNTDVNRHGVNPRWVFAVAIVTQLRAWMHTEVRVPESHGCW